MAESIEKTRTGYKLIADDDEYAPHVVGKPLARMTDTENGLIFKFPSFVSTQQTNYICMSYSEADYIRQLLNTYWKEIHGT